MRERSYWRLFVSDGVYVEDLSPGLKSKHNQAASMVAQLSVKEKAKLCSGRNFWFLEGVSRLDLPSVMVTDGPHGLRKQNQQADHVGLNKSVPATCFPTACALAASWDTNLMHEVGVALGEQCVAEDVAVLLGPGMNIKRHPLCGRNFEYFSEDPLLTGKIAAAMIRGIQSQGVGTSIKHFAVNNQEHGRMYVDAIVDDRALREIYLRGFEIAVTEAQPWTVMCAYNRLNGSYCSEHDWLLNQVLRDEWGFEGLVVTDWGAANDRVRGVASGLDLEMPGSGGVNDRLVEEAIGRGDLAEADLDRAVIRNVSLSLAGADMLAQTVEADQTAHHELAIQAATRSAVLLKNAERALPLSSQQHIAVIGEFAKRPRYQGAGSSQVNPTSLDNAWNALNAIVAEEQLSYAAGYDYKHSEVNPELVSEAATLAAQADVAVVFAGLPGIYESEGFDRKHMGLPEQQNQLIEAVCQANPNTIVVLANGAPVSMPWVDQPKAILEGYLAGQGGGTAIAALLMGIANPSGKIAETFQHEYQDALADQNFPGQNRQVQYREGLLVGYRYFDTAQADVLFPFGHGLSYTQFEYSGASLSAQTLNAGDPLSAAITISNTGNVAGEEVVQLYLHAKNSQVYRAEQSLVGFTKVSVAPGESTTAHIQIDPRSFMFFDQGHQQWIGEAGEYELRFAASSRDVRATLNVVLNSNDAPSAEALAISGPNTQRAGQLEDEDFQAMLCRDIPAPESIRPFHENSSVEEVAQTWFGAKFKARVVAEFQRTMGGKREDETLNKMFEEMANNMPMRGLVLFSGGKTSIEEIRMVLAVLNGRYLRAIKLWWQRRQA